MLLDLWEGILWVNPFFVCHFEFCILNQPADRNSPSYQQIALLSHSLAQKGFVIITGGNQGAMEAANLGGYLYNKSFSCIFLPFNVQIFNPI